MPELIDRPRVQIKRVTVVKCPLILRVFKFTFVLATVTLTSNSFSQLYCVLFSLFSFWFARFSLYMTTRGISTKILHLIRTLNKGFDPLRTFVQNLITNTGKLARSTPHEQGGCWAFQYVDYNVHLTCARLWLDFDYAVTRGCKPWTTC